MLHQLHTPPGWLNTPHKGTSLTEPKHHSYHNLCTPLIPLICFIFFLPRPSFQMKMHLIFFFAEDGESPEFSIPEGCEGQFIMKVNIGKFVKDQGIEGYGELALKTSWGLHDHIEGAWLLNPALCSFINLVIDQYICYILWFSFYILVQVLADSSPWNNHLVLISRANKLFFDIHFL